MTDSLANVLLEFAGTMVAGLLVAVLVYYAFSRVRGCRPCWRQILPRHQASRVILASLIIAYILVFSTLSLLRHVNFYTDIDLAIFSQLMWNTCQGRWFESTLLWGSYVNFLGHHFSPALLLLTPVYCLWPDPAVLLVQQSILLAVGAIPIFLYARRQTGSDIVALSLSTAYLLFPALQYTNLFDFHETAMSVPLLGFTGYYLLTRRYRLFLVLLILSLMVKEEIAFVAMAFALYILLVQREYRQGCIVLTLAVGWACATLGIIMPALSGHGYFAADRYAYLGTSFLEMATSLLLRPLMVLRHLIDPAKLEFVLHLLVPLGLLPLIGCDTLIILLPTVLYLLLSDYGPQYSINSHYAAPLIPYLFLASVTGIHRLMHWRGRSVTIGVSALVLVTGLASYLFHGPGPLARHFNQHGQYNLWPHLSSGYAALAVIPADAPVITIPDFAAHLAARERIYVENEGYLPVDYMFQEYTARTATPRYPALVPEGHELVYPCYETVFDRDGYWVRRYQQSVPITNELAVGFDDKLTLLAYQWRDESGLQLPVLKPGGYLDLIVAWRAEGQPPERYVFFVHLLDQNFHRWAQVDQEVERGVYPTTLWDPGMVVADHYRLSLPWGTPPSEYQVLIGAYSSATGQRLRPICSECAVRDNALLLGPVRVVKPDSPAPPEAASPQHRLDIRLNDELELVGHDLEITDVQPGGTIPLILTWHALANIKGDYTIAPVLDQVDGARRLRCLEEPVGLTYRPVNWEISEVVRDWHDLRVPPDAPPGQYEILLEVLKTGEIIGEVSLGHLEIQGRPRLFAAPEIQHPLEARVGEGALLLGYDVSNDELRPGDSLQLTLYWQARDEMEISYTVFTHLLDAEEHVWGQMDSTPLKGEAPTTGWVSGEVISDPYDIVVAQDAPPGEYVFEIGMYDATTGRRLLVSADGLRVEGDRLVLGEVTILP